MLLELVPQCIAPHAQEARRLGLIPSGRLQRLNNQPLLLLFERPGAGRRVRRDTPSEVHGGSRCASIRIPYILGQIAHIEGVAHHHHAGMPNDVFQFPHIARPGSPGQQNLRARRQAADGFAILRREFGNEAPLEERQVLLAIEQRGHADFNHRQPVIQIFAELLFSDGGAQVR